MNILVLTPLYYIEGRPELFHDTSAVHYLVKYWAKAGHNVQVIVTYVNYRGQIKRYANSEQRKYWKNGYCLLGSKLFKSDKLLNIRCPRVYKRFKEYTIEKEISLIAAPQEFIIEMGLPVYENIVIKNKPKKSKKK